MDGGYIEWREREGEGGGMNVISMYSLGRRERERSYGAFIHPNGSGIKRFLPSSSSLLLCKIVSLHLSAIVEKRSTGLLLYQIV